MKRYAKLLYLFWTAALGAEMEYRLNFVLAVINNLGNLAGSIFALYLFYRAGPGLGQWRWEEALLVMAMFTFLEGFSTSCLRPNLNQFVTQVEKGTLDFVLLKPVDSQFWLSTRNLSLWGLPNIAYGLGLIAYAGNRLSLSSEAYLQGILPLLLGLILLYCLWFILAATSLWFIKIYNITSLLQSLLEAGRYPAGAYPPAYQFFFTFIVPVAFMTTLPAEVILGRAGLPLLVGGLIACLLMFALARLFWHFALRFYTSASS